MSSKILAELLRADPHGVWILQGWWSNPMKEVLDGFGALRKDHILILDLAALANPKWTNEKTWDGVEFGSTGWIFCNLDNYGGRTGMHGKLREMAKQVIEAMHKATMLKGIGITPEGTFANPAVFDLFWDLPWHEDVPDVDRWVEEYVLRRYGVTAESGEGKSLLAAWSAFEKTVYGKESYDGTTKNNVINENASFGQKYCVGPYFKISYDRELFEEGVDRFMEASGLLGGETYDYDAVDLLRMAMTVAADRLFRSSEGSPCRGR